MSRELCGNCNLNDYEFLFKTWVRASKLQMSQFTHLPELLGAERKRATKASSVQSFWVIANASHTVSDDREALRVFDEEYGLTNTIMTSRQSVFYYWSEEAEIVGEPF